METAVNQVQMTQVNSHFNNVKKMSEIDISKLADDQVILATENLSHGAVITRSTAGVNSPYLNKLINSNVFNNKNPIILKNLGNKQGKEPKTDDYYVEILNLIIEYMVWRSQWIPKHLECVGNHKLEFEMHREWLLSLFDDLKSIQLIDFVAVIRTLEINNLTKHLFQKIGNDLKHLFVGSTPPENVKAEAKKYLGLNPNSNKSKEEQKNNTCSICWEDENNLNEMHILPCEHRLHRDCFAKLRYFSTKCPMCRHNFAEHLID